MKTIFLSVTLSLAAALTVYGQSDSTSKKQTLHGVVKDEKNKPIQNASVIVEGEEAGTATDSLGYFKIDAKPNAVLIINANGYEPLMKEIESKDLVEAVMAKSRSQNGNQGSKEVLKQQTLSNSFKDFDKAGGGPLSQSALLPVFHQNEETKGSRYYFKEWVKGTVIDNNGAVVSDEYCLFNYDKMAHALLVTKDKKSMIQVNSSDIQSFTLEDQNGKYSFERKPLINEKDFLVQLVKPGGKYSLYKAIKTKFEKADYRSDGMVESGKNYDEYVDEAKYYVLPADEKQIIPVELKKKAIKGAFPNEQEKVNSYVSAHKNDFINESFLIGLVNSLNQ
jgi:hypothetical protein